MKAAKLSTALIGVLTLLGCSHAPANALEVAGPVAFVDQEFELNMEALYQGCIFIDDSCVTFESEFSQERFVPVFQAPRTTWDGDGVIFDGRRYTDGNRVRFGGGGISDPATVTYTPNGCADLPLSRVDSR